MPIKIWFKNKPISALCHLQCYITFENQSNMTRYDENLYRNTTKTRLKKVDFLKPSKEILGKKLYLKQK